MKTEQDYMDELQIIVDGALKELITIRESQDMIQHQIYMYNLRYFPEYFNYI